MHGRGLVRCILATTVAAISRACSDDGEQLVVGDPIEVGDLGGRLELRADGMPRAPGGIPDWTS